jgi:hypothetical protein
MILMTKKVQNLPARQMENREDTRSQESVFLRLPDAAAWAALAKKHELSTEQARELQETLEQAVRELEHHMGQKINIAGRAALVARLKRVERLLRALAKELRTKPSELNLILPPETLEYIGRCFTFTQAGDALGKDMFPSSVDVTLEAARLKKRRLKIRDVEDMSLVARQSLGLRHGGDLLEHFVYAVHEPIGDWLEANSTAKAGRSPEMVRQHLVYWLVLMAPEIIGKPAPVSVTGRFVNLCSDVFVACGLSASGLTKLIPRMVVKHRKRRPLKSSGPRAK